MKQECSSIKIKMFRHLLLLVYLQLNRIKYDEQGKNLLSVVQSPLFPVFE